MTVEVIDSVRDYVDLMRELFSFEAIHQLFNSGLFRMRFDAMHAVTGPLRNRDTGDDPGAEPGTVINGSPLEDFGGGHPDPNLSHAHELLEIDPGFDPVDFGAAF